MDLASKKVTTYLTTAQSEQTAVLVGVNGLVQSESTPTVAKPTLYFYDALGRLVQTRNPQNASSFITYDTANQLDRVSSQTDFTGRTTSFDYYDTAEFNAGRIKTQTEANGKKTHFAYNGRGQVTRIWGDVPYPEARSYNDFGELITLKTYRGGQSWASAAWPGESEIASNTTWEYQPTTGLLLRKIDHVGNAVTYTYSTANYLKKRTWQRGDYVTYNYNDRGDLTGMDYTDVSPGSSTPDVSYSNFNRVGQPRAMTDGTGSHTLSYDYASRPDTDTCTSGVDFGGFSWSHHYSPVYGRDWFKIQGLSQTVQHDFGYDPTTGRLESVTAGGATASYVYAPDSDLISTTTFSAQGTAQMVSTRTWEFGVRLQSIANTLNGTPVTSHSYDYDGLNRRWKAALADDSYWHYAYNDRNELISGKHYWADGSAVAGQHFEYNYDNIGNRNWARVGGNSSGGDLRQVDYTANDLNQYVAITTPGYTSITGAAAAASVEVNALAATRKGDYFHAEIAVNSDSGPAWEEVRVSAGTQTQTKHLLFPPRTQSASAQPPDNPLKHDEDGNLKSDGLWNYTWDAENRLIRIESAQKVPESARRRLDFNYDHVGRRVKKTVSTWSGGGYGNEVATKYLYDGWRLVAEVSGSSVLRSYAWGQDLSGTLDDAGGVGGLVAVTDHLSGDVHFPAYDGNGNVMALVKGSGQAVSARYDYGPFGESLRTTGPLAKVNPLRFSTRFEDDQCQLIYYGYRYYTTSTCRWLNRDAIEESGGINLFAFAVNDAVNVHDSLGDAPRGHHPGLTEIYQRMEALGGGVGAEVIKNWTVPFNQNHLKKHSLYNQTVWTLVEDMMREKGVTDLDTFLKRMNDDLNLTLEFAGRIGESRGASAFNSWVAKGGISAVTKGLGKSVGMAIKAGGNAVGIASAFVGPSLFAEAFSNSVVDYARSKASGDDAMNLLDLTDVAINFQNMTGNYYSTQALLDVLLE